MHDLQTTNYNQRLQQTKIKDNLNQEKRLIFIFLTPQRVLLHYWIALP